MPEKVNMKLTAAVLLGVFLLAAALPLANGPLSAGLLALLMPAGVLLIALNRYQTRYRATQ